jgi:hypothetical protein
VTRRRALRLSLVALLCLLLGAATTVAVAWACRLGSGSILTSAAMNRKGTLSWPYPTLGSGWAAAPDTLTTSVGFGIEDVEAAQFRSSGSPTRRLRVERSGWPLRSMCSLRDSHDRAESGSPGWGFVSMRAGLARWEQAARMGRCGDAALAA